MRPFKSKSPVLLIVIALLGIIVGVLILPDVDLPDTAFQRNSSLQALRALSGQVPRTCENASQHISFHFSGTFIRPHQVRETSARYAHDLPIQHKALRC